MIGHARRSFTACLAACVVGCLPGLDGPEVAAPNATHGAVRHCPAEYTIDDGEDGNHQVSAQKGRNGYWYTFADDVGTTITPTAGAKGGTFGMAMLGGANGSLGAARIVGKVSTNGEIVFGGVGVNFLDPKAPYDASAYRGFSFYARVAGEQPMNVRLKVPDANTDKAGGVCTECFNDFGADIVLTPLWTRYEVAWEVLTQLPGWGAPRPSQIDRSKVFGIQLQVATPGADFDVWVDDLQFMGCP